MARNRTSASGGQDPIPAPASGNTIRGRGRGRARGRGRVRIAAPVEGQVPIATQGRDKFGMRALGSSVSKVQEQCLVESCGSV